jgi:hypothetical protein
MHETGNQLIRLLVEQDRQIVEAPHPLPLPQLPTIHYTELAEAPPDSPIATEWNCYRREVGRLLAEGHEDKWVLIKGEQIVGIWDAQEQAHEMQLSLAQPGMIKQILKREPVLRMGYNRLCRS